MNIKNQRIDLTQIGKKWKEILDKREYEIIDKEEDFKFPYFAYGINFYEYKYAQRLKQMLVEKYKGKNLEEVIPGEEIETERGKCYLVKSIEKLNLNIINQNKIKENLLLNFKLIYGIREKNENLLKHKGYKTLEDLKNHPRFGESAKRLLKLINTNNIKGIIEAIKERFPSSHPLNFQISCFCEKENFIILDVETMGLFTRPIILYGVLHVKGNEALINQYLVREIKEEPAALLSFLTNLKENSAIVSFNGRTFDIPYIKERLAYYGIKKNFDNLHFDLLFFTRRAWKEKLPDYRLTTLEKKLLGLNRKVNVPSALVPEFYNTYLRNRNPGPLIPIIEHNRQDLLTLTKIFSKLHEEWKTL
ncbi:MAG: ribonuclease H-like domain-containing protein [candidate division WOR-3 bacterium]